MATTVRLLKPIYSRLCNNLILKTGPLSLSASYSVCRVALNSFKYTRRLSSLGVNFRHNEVSLQRRCFSSDKKLSQQEISEKVLFVCKTFDKVEPEKLTLDAHFMTDLGLDSLDHVELIMNMEDEFNTEIPDGDAEKLLRPRDIVEYIMRKEELNFAT